MLFVSAHKTKKFCVTRHRKVPPASVQLKKPHGSSCATLLPLSDIHGVIDRSWHCLIVVGFAILASRRRHAVVLLDCRSFAFRHAALHRLVRIGELLWTLTWILPRQSRVVRRRWRTSIATRNHVKLHAWQRVANRHTNRLLCHLKLILVNNNCVIDSGSNLLVGTRRCCAAADKYSRWTRRQFHKLGKQCHRACTESTPSSDGNFAAEAVTLAAS